jgi:uncharacterized protein (DUF302 family)
MRRWIALSLVLLFAVARADAQGMRLGVYVNIADSVQGSLDDAAGALRSAFTAGGWEVLAVHEASVDRAACTFGARVLVLHHAQYAQQVLARGPRAAFALPLRLVLYQDEGGIHLAVVNPHSVNRTIIAETGFEGSSEEGLSDMVRIASGAVRGVFVPRQFGQIRTRGLIGKTMGVMAGGPFSEKIEEVYGVAGTGPEDVRRVAGLVAAGLRQQSGRGRWQLRQIYQLDLSAQGVIIFGVSGAAMEAQAFRIVGPGGDDTRAAMRCPGVDHAGAFPIEVVVYLEGGRVRVGIVDAMYRMKMFFEDAGRMKFAQNMGMPGSIEDEMRGMITAGITGAR